MKTQATASFLLHTKISEFPKIDQEEVLQKVKKNIVEFIQNTTVDEKKKKKSLEIVQHVSIDDITINSHNRLIDILTTKSYVDNIINSHEFQNILNTVYLKKYNNSAIIFNDDQKKYVKDWSDIIQKDLVQLLLKEANCYTDDDRHDLDGIINLIFSNA